MTLARSPTEPSTDHVVREVIGAFRAAQVAGLSLSECYKRAIVAWLQAHPDQEYGDASCKAIEVVIRSRRHTLIAAER